MKIAIVHDYLTQRGGAERVVLAMADAFPDAPIHTSLYEPRATFPEFADLDVRPSRYLNRVAPLRTDHRRALPLLAPSFSRLHVDADVVVCSSSAWAHGVRTNGRKLVYCYNPPRWLYQSDEYLGGEANPAVLVAASVLRPLLRPWDRRAARSADAYLAISTVVRDRIRLRYGIDAELLPPPHAAEPRAPRRRPPEVPDGFHLSVNRLLPYKNTSTVVAAFAELPSEKLVVVGRGPERTRLRALATPNVTFLEDVDDDELRWLYGSCRSLISLSHEDFGLTPLEANAFGRPAVLLRAGGFLDTGVEGVTCEYVPEVEVGQLLAALSRYRARTWDPTAIAAHAEGYGRERFVQQLRRRVAELAG